MFSETPPFFHIIGVHWPDDTHLVFSVPLKLYLTASGNTFGPADAVYEPGVSYGSNYAMSSFLIYPDGTAPWFPPYPDPRVSGASRPSGVPDAGPEIDLDDVTFTDMPILQDAGETSVSWGSYQHFNVGGHAVEPTGELIDGDDIPNMTETFRAGTDITIKLMAITFIGAPHFYTNLEESLGEISFRGAETTPFTSTPGMYFSYFITDVGELTVDFADTVFSYDGNQYEVIGRHIDGPYEVTETDETLVSRTVRLLTQKIVEENT